MDIAEQIRTDPDAGARRLVADLGPGLYAFALRMRGTRRTARYRRKSVTRGRPGHCHCLPAKTGKPMGSPARSLFGP